MLKINTVTMEEKIKDVLEWHGVDHSLLDNCTKELLNLFSVNTRELEEKGLTYAYDLAKETHLNEDGILTINADVLQMVAKDYVKHVKHFLNVC